MSSPRANTPLFPTNAASVTPSAGAFTPSAVYVGVAGDVVCEPADAPAGVSVTFQGIPAGAVLPVMVRRIIAAGTTAGGFVRIW